MAARPIGRPGDEEYKYELPDDDDGPVLTHLVARRVFMAGRFEPSARDEGGWDGGCAKCQEALALTIADQQAVVTHSMLPKPAHEHCHQCDTVARADEPGICPACTMPTEGTSGSESDEVGAADMPGHDDSGVSNVLTGETTGGVTREELRMADHTFRAQMHGPRATAAAADPRLADLLEIRETHPAVFVHVMSVFATRDAEIARNEQLLAERDLEIADRQARSAHTKNAPTQAFDFSKPFSIGSLCWYAVFGGRENPR